MDNEDLINCIKQIFCEGFFLIGAADGKIDKLELQKFIDVINNRSKYFSSPYVRSALADFCNRNCQNNPNLVLPNAILCVVPDMGDNPSIADFLSAINSILKKIVEDFSLFGTVLVSAAISDLNKKLILNDLVVLMKEIARASGGFLGFNKVSDDEKRAFILAMSAIGFDSIHLNQLLVDFS